MYVKKISLICLILLSGVAFGQKSMTDKTHELKEVVVRSNQMQDFAVGSSIQKMDSLSKMLYSSQSFAELLASRSQVLIRSYGFGGLSTPSIRGGAAAHTAVIWNGVNIQSPMDGSVNFALLPNFLFDDVTIQYGGSGTLYGSGAVSGIIHLGNDDLFVGPSKMQLGFAMGSFGQTAYNGEIKIGNQNISNSFRFYSTLADNDFEYKDANGMKVKQTNAGLEQYAFINETQLRTGKTSILKATAWYQTYDKDLQTRMSASSPSEAVQENENLRLALNWQNTGKRLITTAKSVYLKNDIYFFDPSYMTDGGSNNISKSIINEVTAKYIINENQVLIAGINHTYEEAESGNYISLVTQNRTSLFVSHKLKNLFDRFTWVNSIRGELVDGETSPIVFSSGLNTKITDFINFNGNISRTYSNPRLNDLYWAPSAYSAGNPDLIAEHGWSLDFGFDESFNVSGVKLDLKQNFFLNSIKDWIVWLPNENYIWIPENKNEGKTIGLDLGVNAELKSGSTKFSIGGSYTWTYSRYIEIVGGVEVEKEMLYIPRHRFDMFLKAEGTRWSIMYNHNYIDQRIPDYWGGQMGAYFLGDLSFQYTFFKGIQQLSAVFKIQNLWDRNYQVINDYAMPGRNFKLSLMYNLNFVK